MGTWESLTKDPKKKNISNRGKPQYCGQVNTFFQNNNPTNLGTAANTISQTDITNNNEISQINHFPLYKYHATYTKKGEQTSVMTATLIHTSITKTQQNSNSMYSCIDEIYNEESSNEEYISDGKMNKKMLEKSMDQTTRDSFHEFLGREEKILCKKSDKSIDFYSKKKSVENNENQNKIKNDENEDVESNISRIPYSQSKSN